MKNIIVGPAFPLRGGIANFNEALCKAFNSQGVESEIVSFSLQYPSFLFPGSSQKEVGGKILHDIRIHTLINSINPFSWYKVAKKIKKLKPDYVIFRYWLPFMAPCLGTIARLIKRKSSIKIIAITDNIMPHERRVGDKLLTKYFLKACDGFVVLSKSVGEDLKKFEGDKPIIYNPHPIYDIFGEKLSKEAARKHLGLADDQKYILFFGFIRRYKGLDLLLEAMGKNTVKDLGIKLIIAGEFYEKNDYYENIIKKNNLESNVILKTKYIPKEEVKYYFSAADMVVQPYHTSTQSGVTQIAYHFERPMLVTNVGGLAETVPNGKVGYVTEKNPDEIANAIADFYKNSREEEFSNNTKLEKKKFEWKSLVEKIEELITSII